MSLVLNTNRPLIVSKLYKVFLRSADFHWCLNLRKGDMDINCSCEHNDVDLMASARAIIPEMRKDNHKGLAGRVGIVGGSVEYTGAPYFAAISALRVGCDLSHVFCLKEAAPVIKSYSPELIVHPLLDAPDAASKVLPWLDRLHVLVVGPGLGRETSTLSVVAEIMKAWRNAAKPLVVDADGLFLIGKFPDLVRNYPGLLVITPNAVEFPRLLNEVMNEKETSSSQDEIVKYAKSLAKELGTKSVVLRKGKEDIIASGDGHVIFVKGGGSPRRAGGQGDLLSGSLATFLFWASLADTNKRAGATAAYAACRLVRECNSRAFLEKGRGALATDMLAYLHIEFNRLFES